MQTPSHEPKVLASGAIQPTWLPFPGSPSMDKNRLRLHDQQILNKQKLVTSQWMNKWMHILILHNPQLFRISGRRCCFTCERFKPRARPCRCYTPAPANIKSSFHLKLTFHIPSVKSTRFFKQLDCTTIKSIFQNLFWPKWVFPKIGGKPQTGWFIMEHPIRMDDLGGKPTIFGNIQNVKLLKSHWLIFVPWTPAFLEVSLALEAFPSRPLGRSATKLIFSPSKNSIPRRDDARSIHNKCM